MPIGFKKYFWAFLGYNPLMLCRCEHCHRKFETSQPNRKQRFCGMTCNRKNWLVRFKRKHGIPRRAAEYRQAKPLITKMCWCGTEFKTRRSDKIHCTVKCCKIDWELKQRGLT